MMMGVLIVPITLIALTAILYLTHDEGPIREDTAEIYRQKHDSFAGSENMLPVGRIIAQTEGITPLGSGQMTMLAMTYAYIHIHTCIYITIIRLLGLFGWAQLQGYIF